MAGEGGITAGGSGSTERVVPGPPGSTDAGAQPDVTGQAPQPITDNTDPNVTEAAPAGVQQAQQTYRPAQGPSRQDMMDAISALPERFIDGIREAFPSPPNSQPSATEVQNGADAAQNGESVTGGGQVSVSATAAQPASTQPPEPTNVEQLSGWDRFASWWVGQ